MKKFFVVLLILTLLAAGGLVYLNKAFLPGRVKLLIVNSLRELTHQEVSLEALNFSIFRGLVLTNLVVGGPQGALIKIEKASCGFLILPIFKRTLVIPALNIDSASLFLERRQDKSLNLQELFPAGGGAGRKPKFNLFIRRISAKNLKLRFLDNSLAQPFAKELQEASLNVYFSLPDKIRFNFKGRIPAQIPIKLKGLGSYTLAARELKAKVYLQDFDPQEFRPYYRGFPLQISGGRIDSQVEFKYNMQDKAFSYSGKATLINLALRGVNIVDEINEINAEAAFDNTGISSQNLSAVAAGVPVRANFTLADFDQRLIKAEAAAELSLETLKRLLKDKLNFSLPAEAEGSCAAYLMLEGSLRLPESLRLNGYLDIVQARLKLSQLKDYFENVNGRVEFSRGELSWPALGFDYLGVNYISTGRLIDFKAPQVQFTLSSDELTLESAFSLQDKLIRLSKFSGRYLNSRFAAAGKIDTAEPDYYLDLEAKAQIMLKDSGVFLKKIGREKQAERLKPGGVLNLKASLNGSAKDLKSCTVSAQASSDALSFYGLKSADFFLEYNQAGGIGGIPALRLALYSGTLKGSARIELFTDKLPCRLNAALENLKIEELKNDTAFKGQDISGTLSAKGIFNAELEDLSSLKGFGEVFITDGKLWQLNLFKGLGALIFVRDFANVVFRQGHCSFQVHDNRLFSDDLSLSGDIADLNGKLKLGFDGSIDALLDVKVLDEMVPLTGSFRDIATAVIGQGDRFGRIEIKGTLAKPEYKFKVSVGGIIEGIKKTFFKKQ